MMSNAWKCKVNTSGTTALTEELEIPINVTIRISDVVLGPLNNARTREIRDWDQNTLAVVIILSLISAARGYKYMSGYGVVSTSRLLEVIGHFCKRAL